MPSKYVTALSLKLYDKNSDSQLALRPMALDRLYLATIQSLSSLLIAYRYVITVSQNLVGKPPVFVIISVFLQRSIDLKVVQSEISISLFSCSRVYDSF